MPLCKRLIARLDIKGSRLIKGVRFEGLRVLGDPCEAAVFYANTGADELLYIDSVASLYGRNSLAGLLRQTSREVFIPVTAGGGVRSVTDAASLLAAGADKVAVNTAALQRPELITELARTFGSQCVVASIQARRTSPTSWEAMAESGRERSGRDVLDWIQQVQKLGAGEILLTSVDQDGTCSGPDQSLIAAAEPAVHVPLILGGGFGAADQLLAALKSPNISAISIGSALHKKILELTTLKEELVATEPSLDLRLTGVADEIAQIATKPLNAIRIGIVDYGMGNQQSLINAFEYLGATVLLSDQPHHLRNSHLLALPGVGSYPQGMAELRRRGLDSWLLNWAASGHPLLGICLGMQMLFDSGEEFGGCTGLGLLRGHVRFLPIIDVNGSSLVLPHIGWNQLLPGNFHRNPFAPESIDQYFVHSYAAYDVEPSAVMFNSDYGGVPFVAAVQQGKVAGFQFHPERSSHAGIRLLGSVVLALVGKTSCKF